MSSSPLLSRSDVLNATAFENPNLVGNFGAPRQRFTGPGAQPLASFGGLLELPLDLFSHTNAPPIAKTATMPAIAIYNPKRFADALSDARVSSATCAGGGDEAVAEDEGGLAGRFFLAISEQDSEIR